MKMVPVFVQPHTLDPVTRALEDLSDVHGMSVSRASGFGRERSGATVTERGGSTPTTRIGTSVHKQGEEVMRAIGAAASSGRYGDGMGLVLPAGRALRTINLRGREVEL